MTEEQLSGFKYYKEYKEILDEIIDNKDSLKRMIDTAFISFVEPYLEKKINANEYIEDKKEKMYEVLNFENFNVFTFIYLYSIKKILNIDESVYCLFKNEVRKEKILYEYISKDEIDSLLEPNLLIRVLSVKSREDIHNLFCDKDYEKLKIFHPSIEENLPDISKWFTNIEFELALSYLNKNITPKFVKKNIDLFLENYGGRIEDRKNKYILLLEDYMSQEYFVLTDKMKETKIIELTYLKLKLEKKLPSKLKEKLNKI